MEKLGVFKFVFSKFLLLFFRLSAGASRAASASISAGTVRVVFTVVHFETQISTLTQKVIQKIFPKTDAALGSFIARGKKVTGFDRPIGFYSFPQLSFKIKNFVR